MPSRSSTRVKLPQQSFMEAYQSTRYDADGASSARAHLGSLMPLMSKFRQAGPGSSRGQGFGEPPSSRSNGLNSNRAMGLASSRGAERGGYTLIRSDLQDADLDNNKVLPSFPRNALGVRQRTLQNIFAAAGDGGDASSSHFHWVESTYWQSLSGIVIFANAVIIGLETDYPDPRWVYVEHFLLAFFALELMFRLLHLGCQFFQNEDDFAWNMFDFAIVMCGVFDQWIMPLVTTYLLHGSRGHATAFFLLLRMVRLLRIVRLFRLVKIVKPLYNLAQSIGHALQGMFWVLVFMMMMLYSTAILCTRLIGQGAVLSDDLANDKDVQAIRTMFSSVGESMFTLFGMMSSWSLMKFVPLFEELPLLRPVFVLFYVYSAWALLAVMTGVVSENMIAIRNEMAKEEERREEIRRSMITEFLQELFKEADKDNSGTVSKLEFEALINDPEIGRKLRRNSRLQAQDLRDLFDWLDHDHGGTITIDEFMIGFKWVNEPLRAKSLVRLQEWIGKDLRGMESNLRDLIHERVTMVHRIISPPLRKVQAITEQMQGLDAQITDIRTCLRDRAELLPSAQDLESTESRLHSRMNAVLARIREIEANATGKP